MSSSEVSKKEAAPPKVILTVDPKAESTEEDTPSAANAQTPKHANKREDASVSTTIPKRLSNSSGSAFHQPRESRYYPEQRYYDGYSEYAGGYRYGHYPPPPPPPPPPPYDAQHGPSWGAGSYAAHPGAPYDHHNHAYTRANPNFSRAVSSSFDRSVKSRELAATPVADDASWGQLNQVTSVDEDEMRKRKQRPTSTASSLTNSPRAKKGNLDEERRLESPQSTTSLDLLKCPSGSSAILMPNHQRDMSSSQLSFNSKEESRQDKESMEPASKRKKASPLSISCSPPSSPKPSSSAVVQPQAVYAKSDSYASDGSLSGQHPAVQQLPSWEIYGQDSFGASSQLQGTLSFGQDYLGITASASQEEGRPPAPPPAPSQPAVESRNQSFDQGQYFHRSDSMMSYERQGFDPPRYQGPFPAQAPSWGSASSYTGYYPPPPINRTGSYDNRFQPPPEFRAPPSMVKTQSTPSATIVSNYGRKKSDAPFSWTKEEDNRLTELMKKHKSPRDWEPIAKELNLGRSAKECHERWIRYLKPGVRKGQWTDHEDAIVMEAVSSSAEQPFTRWSDLAQRLPGRVGKQIRDRWVNHLNPNINHMPFSREDDLLLWEGHSKLGKRWVEISTKFFASSRSENHIKNRWYSASFKKFIANEFGPDAYSGTKTSRKKK